MYTVAGSWTFSYVWIWINVVKLQIWALWGGVRVQGEWQWDDLPGGGLLPSSYNLALDALSLPITVFLWQPHYILYSMYLIVSDMPTFWTKSVYDCLVPNIFFSLYWLTSQLTHTCAYSPGLIFIFLMQGLCNISQQGLFGICSGRKIIQSDHRFCIERTTI